MFVIFILNNTVLIFFFLYNRSKHESTYYIIIEVGTSLILKSKYLITLNVARVDNK